MKKLKKNVKGVTMVALVVTIIILLILATVTIGLTIGKNGIFSRGKMATDEHIKQEATEAMNLKITGIQIQSYTENQKLPDLQYLADRLCEDTEMEYVFLESQKEASLDKIDTSEASSIFTKIEKYPYEFEIDRELKLASIDGIKIADSEENIPDGYIKPEGTTEITENGEYDVTNYATAKVDVPVPDNYMEKPTQENVLITEARKGIDVTNYKSIDTSSLFESQGTGEGSNWKRGTTSMTNGNASFSVGFVPSKTIIEITASGYLTVLVINGTTAGTVYNCGNNKGAEWVKTQTIADISSSVSYSEGQWKIVNWEKISGTVSWTAVK